MIILYGNLNFTSALEKQNSDKAEMYVRKVHNNSKQAQDDNGLHSSTEQLCKS